VKFAALLAFLHRRAGREDLAAVLAATEAFVGERKWLKVMGGRKARLLQACLAPGDRVLEFGTFVGYSTLLLAQRLRQLGAGGHVVSCDVDVEAAEVARAVLALAGVGEAEVEVRVGAAADYLAAGLLSTADVLVLDHRGTRYHQDLAAAERGVLAGRGSARVFADNVLLPGAPLFLAHVGNRYRLAIHEVDEFLKPGYDDWVVVASAPLGLPPVPASTLAPELRRLSAEIDAESWRSEREPVDWKAFQRRLAPALYRLRAEQGL